MPITRLFLLLGLLFTSLAPRSATAQETEFIDNLVIVLDASGSMDEYFDGSTTKMAAARSALKTVLQTVPESTHIGLLVFSGHGYQDNWLHPLGPRNDSTLQRGIQLPMPSGRTPLGAALKVGADRLLAAREAQHGYGNYRMLVVTDGEATDPQLVDSYAPDVVGRGVAIDLIGVAMTQDHSLKRLANSYRSADDPTTLTQAILELVAEVDFEQSANAGAEVFEVLDGLPDDFALALLQSLESRANHPIGQAPPKAGAKSSSGTLSSNRLLGDDTGTGSGSSTDGDATDVCCCLMSLVFLFLTWKVTIGRRKK